MNELANKLAYKEEPLHGYVANEPSTVDFTWQLPALFTTVGLINKGRGLLTEYAPYLNDIWQGRNLLFSNLFNTRQETRKMGEEFFKDNLVGNSVKTKFGEIGFRSKRSGETKPEYMWHYPIARFNLSKAKNNIKMPNTKPELRKDADVFDNIEVNLFGKKYDYQVRNNKNDKTKDLYNIKDYKFLEKDIEDLKNKPDLYQKFIEMNNKGL